jgi:folate-dependent phosphoribosylglycinamide formyltransferase PurN
MASIPEFRIAILASGGGTTFEAVHTAIETGELQDTEIAYVVCNNGPKNPDARVWEKAQRLGVDIHHISNLTQEPCTLPELDGGPMSGTISYEASEKLVGLAEGYDIDMYAALGYMKRVIGPAIEQIPIANTHPGPLPATAGEHGTGVQEKVMRLGLDYSGPTFHWMDDRIGIDGLPQYDSGA